MFLRYWTGSRQVDAEQQQLAQKQVDFYAGELLRKPPYSIAPDTPTVTHAQLYLNNFRGENRIYAAMLNDADRAGETINFNKRYPQSMRIRRVCHSRSFYQKRIRLHADRSK